MKRLSIFNMQTSLEKNPEFWRGPEMLSPLTKKFTKLGTPFQLSKYTAAYYF